MRARARTILTVLLAAAVGLPAWAGWYQDYTAAKKDIERKRYDSAARLLQRAIAEKPASELNARTSGMWREDYLPHFYLGICYLRLGDVQRAEAELRAEERAGQIASRGDLMAQLREGLEEIGQKRGASSPPSPTPTPQPAPPQPAPVQPQPTPQPVPAPAPPKPTPAPVLPPPPAPKPTPVPPAPKPAPTPAPRPAPPSAPGGGLDAAMRDSVLEGFRLAEQGFYAKAADAIATAAGDRGSDAKLAALLKAYSGSFLYNAYLLSQPPDDALRDRAREAFVEAAKLDPGLVLPERYFSPRVVSFYEGIRSSAGR